MAIKKYIDSNALHLYSERMKEYIDVKVELAHNHITNCPNCGAAITGMQCPYCGTDFEAIMRINI